MIFHSTRVKCATREDHYKLDRALGYLHSTYDTGLILEAHKSLQIISYVDVSIAVHADMRSHSGCIITLGRGAIWSKSARQKLNTKKSSTEAEFVEASDLCSQVLWTREFTRWDPRCFIKTIYPPSSLLRTEPHLRRGLAISPFAFSG